MEKPQRKLTAAQMAARTYQKKQLVEHAMKLAENFSRDPERSARMTFKRSVCMPCHYVPRVATCAVTSRHCSLCGEKMWFSSGDVDELCVECARANNLCQHCGGDRDLRTRRRSWPGPAEKEAAVATGEDKDA